MSTKKFTINGLQKAINSNIMERERLSFAGQGLDQKHDRIWCELGYKQTIEAEDYRFAYERHPAATAAVHRTLDKCWEKFPEIMQAGQDKKVVTPWEKDVNKLMRASYPFIKDADRRNLVNRYSCLIIQFRDGKTWDQPVDKKIAQLKDKAIVRLIPAWEEQMKPSLWNMDATSDEYGKPAMWQYYSQRVIDDNEGGQPNMSQAIHPDRVLVLAEGAMDGSIYSGIPLLRAGFNMLIDMQKSGGGSAEGFLKNASRQIHINYNGEKVTIESLMRAVGAKDAEELLDMINGGVADLNEAIDACLVTMGGEAQVLSVAPADPQPTWEVSANSFCASIRKPFTIIFGQQTGRLASDEDKADDANTASQRRVGFLDHVIKSFITKLQGFDIIAPMDEFDVEWPELLEPSPSDRATLFSTLATANKAIFESVGQSALTINELRIAAGFEPIKEPKLPKTAGEGSGDDDASTVQD